ncbi:PRTRC system protein B [Burkholderia plantarii]|uniref:PRTRC system protein B n=1 Tax=Burkholderia plantarii TaxID=41899 RepID=UPI00272CAE1C|nr:PRTRC system protein B [Burkholderia plantarii]WLE60263.1 PRTRC system protein B [Burkholderia plantarii]
MTSVQIKATDETKLSLDSALMLYRSADRSQVYVTRHTVRVVDGVPHLLAGTPATRRQLAAFIEAASTHTAQHGFVHERVIYSGPETVAWWLPAGQQSVWFRADAPLGTRHGRTNHPALFFVARGQYRYVFALAQSERPGADTQLYRPPYFNVNNDGLICTGNVDVAATPNTSDIERYEIDEFFRSRFTHINGTDLIAGGDAVEFWINLLDGAQFPTERLIPLQRTVSGAIQRITQRS